jgi:hypothetical protein
MPAWFMSGEGEFRATGLRFDFGGARYYLAVRKNGGSSEAWRWTAECPARRLSLSGSAVSILKAMRSAEEKLRANVSIGFETGRQPG